MVRGRGTAVRVGLVFGAGGLPGEAFHRGVLRALLDVEGVDARQADVVVGTSVGSLVAASLRAPRARAVPLVEPAPAAMASPRQLPLPDVMALARYALRPWRARPAAVTAALLPPGSRDSAVPHELLRRRYGTGWPRRTTWVVAARRRDGRRVVFGRDRHDVDIATAVAASCAIPGYFRPVRVDGDSYVDGAVHSPTNADLLAGEGLDLVVVSAPLGVRPRPARPVLDLPLRLAWHTQLAFEAAAIRRKGTEVLTVEPAGPVLRALGISPMHALRIDEVEDLAYDHTVALLSRRSARAA